MATICPCVTATTPADYTTQLEAVASFAKRVHIDFMDGQFTPTTSIAPIQAWWPPDVQADVHVMFKKPLTQLETLISLRPHLIIVQAEAEGDIVGLLKHCKKLGIRAGISLLQTTSPDSVAEMIIEADHVLLFSGNLGRFGGTADLRLLDKIPAIRHLHSSVEIGWDGGATSANAAQLARAGIDVINAGGAIQKAADPQRAYQAFVTAIQT